MSNHRRALAVPVASNPVAAIADRHWIAIKITNSPNSPKKIKSHPDVSLY